MSTGSPQPLPTPAPTPAPQCPRCGYDQSGTITSWFQNDTDPNAACPLHHTCSECGLAFDWSDLLIPERATCQGLYEHARSAREKIAWFFRTFFWLLLPWLFWSRVHMHHRAHPRRILAPVLIAIPIFFILERLVLGTFIFFSTAQRYTLLTGTGPIDNLLWYSTDTWFIGAMYPYLDFDIRGVTAGPAAQLLAGMLAPFFLWPFLLLVLPDTRARAKIRLVHIQRAWGYSAWPLILLFAASLFAFTLDFIAYGIANASIQSPLRQLSMAFIAIAAVGGVVYVPWLALWWSFALAKGWRVHRPKTLIALLSFASILAALVALTTFAVYT
ncbi:hypothetical protein LBMAG48_28070 [Phycisphaerae bacterium]|nr:hypothetical protein LBMAG48_28070 [Phycisphaerae bacterium]